MAYYRETTRPKQSFHHIAPSGAIYEIELSTNPGRPDNWNWSPLGARWSEPCATRALAVNAANRHDAARG